VIVFQKWFLFTCDFSESDALREYMDKLSMKNSNTSDVILQCSVSFEQDEFTSNYLLHVKVKVSLCLIN
jgi:hypothetical protein